MPQIIPLQAAPAQTFLVGLNGQSVQLNVYQKFYGVFVDVYLSNSPLLLGALAENLVWLVRSQYLGFSGDLVFNDTQGTSNPQYAGLGNRYQLLYYAPSEIPAGTY